MTSGKLEAASGSFPKIDENMDEIKTEALSPEEFEKQEENARKRSMQHLLSLTRKAVQDYDLIPDGSRVCVGISGGKDSLALAAVLEMLSRFYPKKFSVCAVSVDAGFENMDFGAIASFMEKIGVPYEVVKTEISKIVFDVRKEKNPCALCANLRRGALNDKAKQMGASLVALGHHRDDVIETAFLSLSFEGRFYCFQPKTFLDRSGVTVIRPFIYVPESDIRSFVRLCGMPVLKSPCPMDKTSKRAETKIILREMNARNPILRDNIFGAVKRGLWDAEGPRDDEDR